MPGVLYVVDLDGTLLQPDATLSERSRAILAELLADGCPITIATARSVVSIRGLLAGLEVVLPVVEFDGAFLSDFSTGQHLRIRALRPEVAGAVFDAMVASGHTPLVSTFDGRRDRLYVPPPANGGVQWYLDDRRNCGDERLTAVDDVRVGLREQVVCLTAIGEPDPLEVLHGHLCRTHDGSIQAQWWQNLYDPGWYWLSVRDHAATKHAAVAELMALKGLGGAQVIAFGDHDNDLGLLARADRGVAVANALPRVKAGADEVIGPNTCDSVACYIQADWQARR